MHATWYQTATCVKHSDRTEPKTQQGQRTQRVNRNRRTAEHRPNTTDQTRTHNPTEHNRPDRTYSRKPTDKNKRQGYAIEPDKHYPTSTRDAYIHTSPKAVSEPDAPEARTTDAAKAASGERAALCCTETRRLNFSNAKGGYSTFPTQRGV